ncbi:Zn-dependent exopeptidase [Ascodesmis nigricans]|uniref:Zn-dependent exopeptidase n=1 Tax=Ascodesmis nigricans TaxID=341454 RepID=A0A4S2N6R7_9PEZI|nr:Zn-dependent exopeptidase [Ascodesmis nigricans]
MKFHPFAASLPLLLLSTGPGATAAIQFQLPAGIRAHLPAFIRNFGSSTSSTPSPLLTLHEDLVSIPSVTGNETAVARFLADYLTAHNFTVETQHVSDGLEGERFNVFAYLGKERSTHMLITSHLDTVPPFIPYSSSRNTIYGRGSNDAKGSVAAQITAVEELIKEDLLHEGDISLLYVVGEETTGDGMKAANNLRVQPWKSVIFGEPTENKLAVGHKGILMFDVIAKGKASHSGYPHLGVNANSHLIQALAVLDNLELPASKLLGASTLNVGRMEGGVAYNVIPAFAKAKILVRVAADLEETIKALKESVKDLPVELEFTEVAYGPVELDYDVKGFETIVCAYGTDVANLHGEHKKYLYGPGSILTAHGENEFILKSDLTEAVAGYKKLIKHSMRAVPVKEAPAAVTENKVEEEKTVDSVVESETVGPIVDTEL